MATSIKSFLIFSAVFISSISSQALDIGKCNPNKTFIEVTSKTRFCGYFNMTTVEANNDEIEAYIETMKLVLSRTGAEVIYGKNRSGHIIYKFDGGALNQVSEQFNNDILKGSIVEVTHTHPWFAMNTPNPSGSDREAFVFWASNNRNIVFKIIYSPSIDNNSSMSEIEDYVNGKKTFKVLTSIFYPQFAE